MKENIIMAYMMRVDEKKGCIYQGYVAGIANSLKAIQEFVGGPIQAINIEHGIVAICNDDGKCDKLLPNRVWFGDTKAVSDIAIKDSKKCDDVVTMYLLDNDKAIYTIVGNILVVRCDGEGNFTSIQEEDIPVIEGLLLPVGFMDGEASFIQDYKSLPEYIECGGK